MSLRRLYAKQRTMVLQLQPDARHRARVLSAGGLHAGSWLCVLPITMHTTAHARHYQFALALRLGLELPELLPAPGAHIKSSSVVQHIVVLLTMRTPSTLAFAALAIATGSGLFDMMRCSSCSFT